MPNKNYKINKKKITWHIIDDETVILNLETGFCYNLNKTGTLIWQGLVGDKDSKSIVDVIKQAYKAPEKGIRKDVESLIEELEKEEIVEAEK
jgi:hypothetical protein